MDGKDGRKTGDGEGDDTDGGLRDRGDGKSGNAGGRQGSKMQRVGSAETPGRPEDEAGSSGEERTDRATSGEPEISKKQPGEVTGESRSKPGDRHQSTAAHVAADSALDYAHGAATPSASSSACCTIS